MFYPFGTLQTAPQIPPPDPILLPQQAPRRLLESSEGDTTYRHQKRLQGPHSTRSFPVRSL